MTGVMEAKESAERVWEGLGRAASCCRELAGRTGAIEWKKVATQLLLMRDKAMTMYRGQALTEAEILYWTNEMEKAQRLAQSVGQARH